MGNPRYTSRLTTVFTYLLISYVSSHWWRLMPTSWLLSVDSVGPWHRPSSWNIPLISIDHVVFFVVGTDSLKGSWQFNTVILLPGTFQHTCFKSKLLAQGHFDMDRNHQACNCFYDQVINETDPVRPCWGLTCASCHANPPTSGLGVPKAQEGAEGQEGLLCLFLGNKNLFLNFCYGSSWIEQPSKINSTKWLSQNSLFHPNMWGNRAKKWSRPMSTISADPWWAKVPISTEMKWQLFWPCWLWLFLPLDDGEGRPSTLDGTLQLSGSTQAAQWNHSDFTGLGCF